MASLTHGAQVGRLEVVGTSRRRRWSEEEKLSIVAEVRGWYRRPRAAMAFRRRCCLLGAALIVTDICGGAAPPAISQRDSDHVFEHKLLRLRRLHFAKVLRGPTRAVSPMYFPLRTGPAARQFCHQ